MSRIYKTKLSDGSEIRTLSYRGAEIRIYSWVSPVGTGKKKTAEIHYPNQGIQKLNTHSLYPTVVGGYFETNAAIISDAKFIIREAIKL